MKKIKTTFYFFFLFSLLVLLNSTLTAGDKQLITALTVTDIDFTYRYLYFYDNNGNKVVETKSVQKDNSWFRKSQTEWIYEGDKCVLQRESSWINNKWKISYEINYQYENGDLIAELHQSYTNEAATLVKKIDFSYSSSVLTLRKEYMRLDNRMLLSVQTDFIYNLAGYSDSVSITIFDLGVVKDQYLMIKKYNENGTIANEITKIKNKADEWTNAELVNFFYLPGSTNLYSQRNKKWNSDDFQWENTQRIDYQYDNLNRMVSETYQYWNVMFWANNIRYDYKYENDNLVKKALSLPIYNKWRSIISINYSDFKENKANNIESQFDFWGGITGEFTTSFIPFNFNDEQEIKKGRRIQLNYLPVIDTASSVLLLNLKREFPVYPNPSSGVYYINPQEFKIISWKVMDLHGRVLKLQNHSVLSGIIDISDLPNGIYVLDVNCDDQRIIQKLIKK